MTWARRVGEAAWSPEANRRWRPLGGVQSVPLRSSGQWAALVTHPSAAAATVTSANLLSSELGRVYSTSAPARVSSASADGIRVGLAADWGVSLPAGVDWSIGVDTGRGYVVGRTDRGLSTAVRRLLHLLGYRRLSTTAERFPALVPSLLLPTEARTLPLRFMQNLGNLLVNPDQQQGRRDAWAAQNVAPDYLLTSSGHRWAAIVAANPTQFGASHPERTGGGLTDATVKLACYDPAVQAIALADTIGQFAGGTRWGATLSASDGGGWTLATGTGEEVTRSPTDRVLHLGNAVQPGLGADQHVVLLAYAEASLPPVTETVDPRIVLMPTTALLQGGQSWEDVADAFTAKGAALLACYDYQNEWIWSGVQDRPGGAAASDRAWVVLTRSRLLRLNAGYNGEDYAGNAVVGRARYAIAGYSMGDDPLDRWDEYPSALFPSAPVQRVAWFTSLESGAPFSTDLVRQLILAALDLIAATAASAVVGEHTSALHCGRYAYSLHLLRAWSSSQTTAAFEALLRYLYRDRHCDEWCFMGPYSTSLWATQRKAVAALHALSDLTATSGATIWGDAQTTEPELVALLTAALPLNPAIPFTLVGFSNDYVRASGLANTRPRGTFGTGTEINRAVQYWMQGSGTTHIVLTGGIVRSDLGPDHVTITERASGTVLLDVDVAADGTPQAYDLPLVLGSLYLVDVTSKGGCKVAPSTGTGFWRVLDAGLGDHHAGVNAFVYVPRRSGPYGVDVFGFFANGGTISVFDRNAVRIFGPVVASQSYLSFTIPDGVDGTVIEIVGAIGAWSPLTTPPGAALAAGEIGVPREVAVADGLPYVG